MANEQKILLATQPEKPNHYTYLKEFRVEQCQSFLQHKCNQHRPFICFNWHFMNQRRRRPVRKRDGTFNYSADNYCTKYDETTGICPDGDDCPFLHRTAGDTERRYHLRYYKTCMCVHDTDARGYCVKNGHHCAFAHGVHDQRPPVYDIKELEALQNSESTGDGTTTTGTGGVGGVIAAQNALDKERNLMNEDPKWQDTNYVLANYKTEPCKRPPRLCRQGYACPQYHNSKDKRRSPRKFKYRSTPCPNVKHGEEWGEPANCEAGDNCQYCHTRTEQQFHPEIYKSTKCNDVQQAGYCPRSVFCAFAHVEQDKPRELDGPSTNLALSDIISNALPEVNKKENSKLNSEIAHALQNGNGESCESASTSSIGSNHSHSKAPGAQLQHQKQQQQQQQQQQQNSIFSNNSNTNGTCNNSNPSQMNNCNSISQFPDFDMAKQLMAMENENIMNSLEKNQNKYLNFALPLERLYEIRDMVPNQRENPLSAGLASGLLQRSSAPINIPNSPLTNSISVNIPGHGSLGNYSPTNHSNLFSVAEVFSGGIQNSISGGNSGSKLSNSLSNQADSLFFQPHIISPGFGDSLSISPSLRISDLNMRDDLSNNTVGNSLFENSLQSKQFSMQSMNSNPLSSEINRLKEELSNKNAQILKLSSWKLDVEECTRNAKLLEMARDKFAKEAQEWKERYESAQAQLNMTRDLRNLSINKLKLLQTKLRTDMEEVEKVLYSETATKCMKCEENNRTVTLDPCNHYVLCENCALTVTECPYCQMPVTTTA